MDNVANNSIKQPAPNINVSDNQKKQVADTPIKREIKRPNVGIIEPCNISTTPLADTIELRKKENPYTKYKLSKNNKYKSKFSTFTSIGIMGLSLSILLKGLFKK